MNVENVKKLLDAAPSLYGDSFYFECHDGWFDILLDASIKLEKLIQTYPKDVRDDIVALQVKEKYGTLRFYLSYYTEELDAIIQTAETQSACTCEVCGSPGKIRGYSWLYVACNKHTQEFDIEQNSIQDNIHKKNAQ